MKDFLGNDIKVGDEVVFVRIGYRDLSRGTIKSITDKTVLITHGPSNISKTETRQFHSQVVKI